jgi:hypothetical protein
MIGVITCYTGYTILSKKDGLTHHEYRPKEPLQSPAVTARKEIILQKAMKRQENEY